METNRTLSFHCEEGALCCQRQIGPKSVDLAIRDIIELFTCCCVGAVRVMTCFDKPV